MPKLNIMPASVASISLPGDSPMEIPSPTSPASASTLLTNLAKEKAILIARVKAISALEKKVRDGQAIEKLAKRFAYHALKNTPSIPADVLAKLNSVGLVKLKKDGTPFIPWHFVKAYTDDIYDNMTPEAKAPYIARATKEITEKAAM